MKLIKSEIDLMLKYHSPGSRYSYFPSVSYWQNSVSKDGLISIDDRLMAADDVSSVMYDKRLANPQIVVSLKGDEEAEMGLVSKIHENLREVEALKLNYSSKTLVD